MMQEDVARLATRLIAAGFLSREDPAVIRALTEQPFREELDRHLGACGLMLLDNPYAEHVAIAVTPDMASAVFGDDDGWLSNTLKLAKPEVAFLVVLWALLVIPKRERQLAASDNDADASSRGSWRQVKRDSVLEATFVEDFKHLWSARYIRQRLTILARYDFITVEDQRIYEGPRLDLVFDYSKMAPRIRQAILANYREIMNNRQRDQESGGAELSSRPAEDDDDV